MDPNHEQDVPETMEEMGKLLKDMKIPDNVLQASLVEAMRAGLENLVGTSSGYLESLPGSVKARISYLESIQADYDALDDSLNDEIKALERKYKPMFDKLLQLRKKVISGEEEVPEEHSAEYEEEEGEGEENEEVEGIPDFWLVALSNQPMFDEMITQKDAEILAFLEDVSFEDILDESGDEEGYKLTFTFKENDYFSNKELSLIIELYQESGMMQVDRLEGTDIKWKSDSVNPTVKIMKKKAKAGKKPAIKKEKTESFFNIFSPPILEEIEDMDEEAAEETQEEIEKILAMGEILREDLVPNAVRWFTGEAAQDDEEDEDDDDDDDEDDDEMYDDDDDDEDDEEDDKAAQPPLDAKEAECKQQ